MRDVAARDSTEAILRHERAFVIALGGYVVEIPGAHLVVHERLPAPNLNFVQVHEVPPARQASFIERALDHYFQRAIRPSFRLPTPVPAHLDTLLRKFEFSPRPEPHLLLVAMNPATVEPTDLEVRPARLEELDAIVAFWGSPGTREEFRRSIDVLWNFPYPSERLEPLVAMGPNGAPSTAGLLYRNHGIAGIHAVATHPDLRGKGAASDLVHAALLRPMSREAQFTCMTLDRRRGSRRLGSLGFEVVSEQVNYELSRDAQLVLPSPGPPGPPRWRPPRT